MLSCRLVLQQHSAMQQDLWCGLAYATFIQMCLVDSTANNSTQPPAQSLCGRDGTGESIYGDQAMSSRLRILLTDLSWIVD